MNSKHPTDPAQLARWLRTPRVGHDEVENACAITVYEAASSASRWIGAGLLIALALLAWVAGWGAP